MPVAEVVITGVGIVSPIGIGRESFWDALLAGHCGIGTLARMSLSDSHPLVGEVRDFDPKKFVANRKSLKVMSRDAQLGVAAAALACRDAGIVTGKVDPERFGVVFGADGICSPIEESETTYGVCLVDGQFAFERWGIEGMSASFPLGFLRVLPNMVASHVSIAQDARGPNNTIHEGEISSLLAVIEAASVIQRGMADVMLAGGASSQLHPLDFVRRLLLGRVSPRFEDPAAVVRPFDALRDGYVWSEGGAAIILESRQHAQSRGAKILARLKGWGTAFEPAKPGGRLSGDGLRRAISAALDHDEDAANLGHVNGHGLSTVDDDAMEAAVLHDLLPQTPVTALKGHFGNAGAAGAAMELAGSILALDNGCVPAVRNYSQPDPACPVEVVRDRPMAVASSDALCLTWMPFGQAAAVVIGR